MEQEEYPELEWYFHRTKNAPTTWADPVRPRRLYTWKCTVRWRHTFRCTWAEMVHRLEYANDNGCPRCTLFGEEQVAEWLRGAGHAYVREAPVGEGHRTRWDFYLPDAEVVIEVDGVQHFRRAKRRWESPAKIRERDVAKMRMAFAAGRRVIRLYQPDIIGDDNWWQAALAEALEQGTKGQASLHLLSRTAGVYDLHRRDL